jgi:methylamine dehydrogenase accessory protein MauD
MLLVSNIFLWILVLVLLTVVLALVRQVGILYERIAPAGAQTATSGIKAGEEMPVVETQTLEGQALRLGGKSSSGKCTLLFFLSLSCPVCKTLLPVMQAIRNSEAGWLDIVLASDGDREEHRTWLRKQGMESWNYVLSPQLGMTMQVGQLPFAALVDENGILRARNPVNSREQIENMVGEQRNEVAG